MLDGIKQASVVGGVFLTWPSVMAALNSLGIGPALARISAKGVIAELKKVSMSDPYLRLVL